jgi:adenylate kinase family enzyme
MDIIATGDILRAHIRDGTPLGAKVKAIMDQGGTSFTSLVFGLSLMQCRLGFR